MMIPPVVEGEDADDDIYDGESASVHGRRPVEENGDQHQEENGFVTKEELPSEEDRKTFLYDVVDEAVEDATATPSSTNEPATPTAMTPQKTLSGDYSAASSDDDCDIPGTKNEVSMFLEEDDFAEEEDVEDVNEDVEEENSDKKQENTNGPRRRLLGRFRRNQNNNSNNKESDKNENSDKNESGDTPSTRTLKLERRRQQKRFSKAQEKRRLASQRHYKRRHLVASQLLQSSCELLLLEKDAANEFYQEELEQQLEALNTPRVVPSSSSTSTTPTTTPTKTNGSNSNQKPSRWSPRASTAATTTSSTNGENNDNDNNNNSSSGESESEENNESKPSEQARQQFLKQSEWMTEWDPQLAEHLPKLSPGAGYKCLCFLLFQLLLQANNKKGYDARVRYALKSLAVAVLVQDIERTLNYTGEDYVEWKIKNYTTWVSFATRKFEQVEHAMAERLIQLAKANEKLAMEGSGTQNGPTVSLEDLDDLDDEVQVVSVKDEHVKKVKGARKQIVRGLKIGAVGITAGTLLAVTGGMAGPAIAGALTFMGMSAIGTTVVSFASTSAVLHIFGVAGGSLAAYKMRRRTAGLTEFHIVQSTATGGTNTTQKEDPLNSSQSFETSKEKPRLAKWAEKAKAKMDKHRKDKGNAKVDPDSTDATAGQADLSRTICISGWLTDKTDFQKPWGITPTKPAIKDKVEILQRFYRVYNPDLIPMCKNLLKRWKSEESTFWELLEDKYGSNPDTLFPLKFGPLHDAALTDDELQLMDKLIVAIGEARGKQTKSKHANLPDHIQSTIATDESTVMESQGFHNAVDPHNVDHFPSEKFSFDDDSVSLHSQAAASSSENQRQDPAPQHHQRQCYASVFEQVPPSRSLDKWFPPGHLSTVWDFSSRYGGEVYTVHWESHMLMKLSECFREVALTATASAGQQALRLMVANTVAFAASIPVYLLQGIDAIDETWTVVVERADAAGKELARSLLINEAGHRPVTLVGYSFGARVIFSCLKQLAVYQQQWEQYHEEKDARAIGFATHIDDDVRKSRKEKKWLLAELEFDREPASVVEDVVIMGAPMYLSLSSWRACRQIVAGRFVNCYSRKDRILSLMFKYKQFLESFKPVVGNCTVAVPGVENIDVTDLVENHQDYVFMLSNILKRVRHGQSVRSSTNALDEVALIAEAETLAAQQQKSAEVEITRQDMNAAEAHATPTKAS